MYSVISERHHDDSKKLLFEAPEQQAGGSAWSAKRYAVRTMSEQKDGSEVLGNYISLVERSSSGKEEIDSNSHNVNA